MTANPPRPWEAAPSSAGAANAAAIAALIPTLDTARLHLRAPHISDFDIYVEATTHKPAPAREEMWLDFCQMAASWLQRGFGPWTITARTSGEPLGFLPVDHEFGDPEPEIGWFVLPKVRRTGIAVEAARAVLDRALPALGFRSIVSYIAASNAASLAVARALGGVLQPAGSHPQAQIITHRYAMPKVQP